MAEKRGPIILVLGMPGSGKGTQCKRLASQYGLVHVSIGDLVREQSESGTELGRAVKEYMSRGDFVPDEVMLGIVKDRLAKPDILKHGVLLDGFPRSRAQAEGFVKLFNANLFLLFQCSDDVAVARCLGRLQDPETGAIYHKEFVPAPEAVRSRLTVRDNDNDEGIVRQRLQAYNGYVTAVVELFERTCSVVNGELSTDQVFEVVKTLVETVPGVSAAGKDEDDWSDDEEAPKVEGPQLCIEVAPSENVVSGEDQRMVAVSIRAPESGASAKIDLWRDPSSPPTLDRTASGKVSRAPTDVCCLVDISGSMSQEATYEDENENVKSDGLSYLDIVKHAVKTVMHILNDKDRLAVVAFDNNAEVAFALDYMTADGRKRATAALEALAPRGRTDIWKGLQCGMDALRTCATTGGVRQKTILLLTDGVPNEVPKRGHITELRDYKECHPDFSFMLNTFGFGYKLDSELLLDLAVEGQGTNGFIPDALIVGTSFVDSVANCLSTLTQNVTVHLTATGGARFGGPVLGVREQMVTETSWGVVVNLGPLQFGGTREVVIPMCIPGGEQPYLEVTVVYPDGNGKESKAFGQGSSRTAAQFAVAAHSRSEVVSIGYQAMQEVVTSNATEGAQQTMAKLAQRVASREAAGGAWVAQLRADVEGRASKALVGKDRFNRWGKHYLRAFMRAHQVQYCTNFMDKSLQEYGGVLFRALREEGDGIFVTLPAPTPSVKKAAPRASTTSTGYTAPARSAPAPDMSVYYGGSGGG